VREYELVYIVQPDAAPEREKEIQNRISESLSRASAITLMWDDWGKRKLAYEIDKFQKGHYVLASFLGGGAAIPEIERTLRLDADVLRFLTVKVSDRVKDVDARVAEARKEEAERAKRREERERIEAERAEQDRRAGRAPSRDDGSDESAEE
jgi:small subunit ribosomal protein S6